MQNPAIMARPDAQQFAEILARTGLSQASLAKLLGVNQSTVSRLKHAKIRKVHRFWVAFEADSVLVGAHDEQLAPFIVELVTIAERRPTLRALLLNLHKLMHEIAHDHD